MAGTSSECGVFGFVKILYDGDEIIGYTSLDYMSELEDSVWNAKHEEGDMFYPYQNLLVAQVLDYDNDQENLTRFYFRKDDKGNVVEVYDPKTKERIEAPSGYHIRSEVVENADFWTSCLDGGFVLLNFYIEPTNDGIKDYTVTKYYKYDVQSTKQYRNGTLRKSTLYSSKTHKPIYSITRQTNGDTSICESTYEKDSNIYRDTWKNGVISSHETVSRYGTVLSQQLYVPSKDGNAFICYDKTFDYKSKRLVRVNERRIDKQELLSRNKETDAMSMRGELVDNWRGYY